MEMCIESQNLSAPRRLKSRFIADETESISLDNKINNMKSEVHPDISSSTGITFYSEQKLMLYLGKVILA